MLKLSDTKIVCLALAVGLLALSAATAVAQDPHVFVPVHWIVGQVSLPQEAPANTPLDGRTVIFYKDDPAVNLSDGTDASGNYTINTYLNEDISIDFTSTYYVKVTVGEGGYTSQAIPFTINQNQGYETVNITLISPPQLGKGSLMGTVTNAGDGSVLAGATVSIPGYDPVQTDVNGNYLINNIDPGSYDVTASLAGFNPGTIPNVNIVADQFTTQNIALTRGAVPVLAIVVAVLPDGIIGTAYKTAAGETVQLTAVGGTPPYSWAHTAGDLPPGLTVNANGTITGTPTTVGPYEFNVTVTDSVGATNTGGFAIVVNEMPLPPGTVPLTINRSRADITVTWDNVNYPNPQIYRRVNAGALGDGIFTNAHDASWGLVSGGNSGMVGAGTYTDAGQVGQGNSEVYYKAIVGGTPLPLNMEGLEIFASAWAVGKINLTLYGGWNLISAPFVGGSLNSILGASFNDNEQVWFWNDQGNKFESTATFSNNSWAPANVNIIPAQGYWLDLSGTPAGEQKTVTIIGTIYTAVTQGKPIYTGWNLIGNPFPQQAANSGFTAPNCAANDQIWVWDNQTQQFTGTKDFDGAAWDPDAKLIPGKGYWYNHIGSGFNWQINN